MATFRASHSDSFSTASSTWTSTQLPVGWQPSDYCIMTVTGDVNIVALTPPAGWTELAFESSPGGDVVIYVYGRSLEAGDTAPTFTWTGTARGHIALSAYYDVHATNPVSSVISVGTTADTTHQITGVSVPNGGGTVVLIIGQDGASGPGDPSTAFTEPAGFTSRVEQTIASGVNINIADNNEPSSGYYNYAWGSLESDEQVLVAVVFGPQVIPPISFGGVWGTGFILGASPPGASPPPTPVGALTWSPPDTSSGTWTNWSPGTGSTRASYTAGVGENVIVNMPNSVRGSIRIVGANNVVMIGGHINVDPGAISGDSARRGIEIQNCTGTVHVEGVLIEHEIGTDLAKQGDAFYITGSGSATVQIQNCRIPMLYGQQTPDSNPSGGDHGDVIQVYNASGNGVGNLYVDKMTYKTVYQGGPMIFDGSANTVHIKRVDAQYDKALAASFTSTGGGAAALGGPPNTVIFEDYYVRETRFTPNTNDSGGSASSGLITGGGSGYWTVSGNVDGNTYYHPSVNNGTTPAITFDASIAEYVPNGVAGTAYSTPGYM